MLLIGADRLIGHCAQLGRGVGHRHAQTRQPEHLPVVGGISNGHRFCRVNALHLQQYPEGIAL